MNDIQTLASGLDQMRVRQSSNLKGSIPISGAKNAALKHMCASLLTSGTFTLSNMPVGLRDVKTLNAVLEGLGLKITIEPEAKTIHYDASNLTSHEAPYELVRKMRASVLVLGPLLARQGQAIVSLPGGCSIGGRPIDLHLKGLQAMGADIQLEDGYVKAKAPKGGLQGADITFPFVSVGATEHLMMAATLAKGKTILHNAAREPEIVDQGEALNKMGAKISGLGSDEIVIEGVEKLDGCSHLVLPDRIETGTYMCAVGLSGGELLLKNTRTDFLKSLIAPLTEAGMEIEQQGDDVLVRRGDFRLKGVDIMTEPYPGFPTDLQAQFMTMLTLCDGAGMISETVFENRFMHVPELCRMGANISVKGNSAIIRGVDALKGAEVMATDLRASVSLVLAGLVAEGETTINRIYHLDRGYEDIVEKLTAVGADIERIKA
ncbi:MAG: UDP-N-acetylglucosamine 1-carboxyvinyltransferase [Pseudomonadota bacterium]